MKGFSVLKKLSEIDKSYYTISDLEKITGLSKDSLYVALNRWVDMKILKRIGPRLYVPFGKEVNVEKIASQLYLPNYLSFESALSHYGILNLIPYTVSLATPRRTRRYTINNRDVEFRQIKRSLFWGYILENGIYIAESEKAFLDQIYFVKKGIASADYDEMELKLLSRKKLFEYADRYPQFVQKELSSIDFG